MELKKNYIYRYRDYCGNPLCIYLCDTQTKNRILIVPLTERADGNVYKLSVTRQYADLDNYKEINTGTITSALYLNSSPVRISNSDLQVIQQEILRDVIEKIAFDVKSNNSSFLFESIYQFLKWKREKFLLNVTEYKKKTDVYENALYWASLGVNVGSELNKNRPVLVWKKRSGGGNEPNYSYIVIPITSKQKNKKYHMNVPIDVNGRQCFLRIEDMRRINIRRFTRPILNDENKIIFISNEKRNEIMQAIKKFYIFENKYTNT